MGSGICDLGSRAGDWESGIWDLGLGSGIWDLGSGTWDWDLGSLGGEE